jgi:hypothetical protein
MTDGGAVTTSEPSPDEWSGLVGQSFVADKLMPNITLNRSAHLRFPLFFAFQAVALMPPDWLGPDR